MPSSLYSLIDARLSREQNPPDLPLEHAPPAADTVAMSELNWVRDVSVAEFASDQGMSEKLSNGLPPFLWLAGSSAAVTQLRSQIQRVAPYFRTALFVGEPGCGEEAAAQMLHQLSPLSHRGLSRSIRPKHFAI